MSMQPAFLAMTVWTGATYTDTLTCLDADGAVVDLTGCTARQVIRDAAGAEVVTLTSPSGGLVIGGTAGTIVRTISAAQTETLTEGRYQTDLFLTWPTGQVDPLQAGPVNVIESATNPTEAP